VLHDCPFVVMYDPAHAICVEPQSGPPDAAAIRPDSAFLGVSQTREQTVTWKWSMASRS
jgi:galactose mutarotase-like enzyme